MNHEIGADSIDRPLDFNELIALLKEAAILQQSLHGRSEDDYDHGRDAEPLYTLFKNYAIEWEAPRGQHITIPESVGGRFQVRQAEYHNEYSWVYPFPPGDERVKSAQVITADLDGVCAHDGDKRVVLYGPVDPFHNDPEVLSQLSLVDFTISY